MDGMYDLYFLINQIYDLLSYRSFSFVELPIVFPNAFFCWYMPMSGAEVGNYYLNLYVKIIHLSKTSSKEERW